MLPAGRAAGRRRRARAARAGIALAPAADCGRRDEEVTDMPAPGAIWFEATVEAAGAGRGRRSISLSSAAICRALP